MTMADRLNELLRLAQEAQAGSRPAQVQLYIWERHSDPTLRISDAALHFGVDERTIRRDLRRVGTTWERLLVTARMETAKRLLISTKLTIRVVARRSGYDSPTSFTAAFGRYADLSPVQWRLAHGGPKRAGGATGAARQAATRARARRQGSTPPSMRRDPDDHGAEMQAEIADARTRIRLDGRQAFSLEELAAEVYGPRGLGRRAGRASSGRRPREGAPLHNGEDSDGE